MTANRLTKQHTLRFYDRWGHHLTPFYFLVSPTGYPATGPVPYFFLQLPPEIRHLIYEQCDPSSLWALMHTTSQTRYECQSYFWAHPEPWYEFDGRWFIGHQAYQGESHHCPDFATRVEQVEYQVCICDNPLWLYAKFESHQHSESNNWWWTTFRHHFPRVKRLVFRAQEPEHMSTDKLQCFNEALNSQPDGIDIYFAISPGSQLDVEPITLWKPHQSQDSTEIRWEVIRENWLPNKILMPSKIANGIVGQCSKIMHFNHSLYPLEGYAKLKLVHDAIGAFYFKSPTSPGYFTCPLAECNYIAKSLQDWMSHRTSTHRGLTWPILTEAYQKLLPGPDHRTLINLFINHEAVNETYPNGGAIARSLGYGTTNWELNKASIIQQLTDDPLHEVSKELGQSSLYLRLQIFANRAQSLRSIA
ncbi:hypothetical protein BT63DRAFT_419987 [Microthyrium microscopicum]|uniref:Uncharacterized protein n=1 Tax=Microthyrium microscopicum TaxID=703497 RepID=A0A6A6UT94_9PEZI|nr:hypothetical protein BT63DRAFT_419987 [Microthyrium microscopicum]